MDIEKNRFSDPDKRPNNFFRLLYSACRFAGPSIHDISMCLAISLLTRTAHGFCRDWERIDNLRIDKYYTLVRVSVREALRFCKRSSKSRATPTSTPVDGDGDRNTSCRKKRRSKDADPSSTKQVVGSAGQGGGEDVAQSRFFWDIDLLNGVIDAVEEEIVTPRMAPIGLRLHLADLWTEEVCCSMYCSAYDNVTFRAFVDEGSRRSTFSHF